MNCDVCQARLNCRYTKPLGSNTRWRLYRCPNGCDWKQTVELSWHLLDHPEMWPELKEKIEATRKEHFRTCRMISRKRKKALATIG